MQVETYLVLDREEINKRIPYAVVAETMSGARWDTGKRRRLMKQWFTETEIDAIYRMKKQARNWYLIKGVPDELRITPHILRLWHKLADFCCQL